MKVQHADTAVKVLGATCRCVDHAVARRGFRAAAASGFVWLLGLGIARVLAVSEAPPRPLGYGSMPT